MKPKSANLDGIIPGGASVIRSKQKSARSAEAKVLSKVFHKVSIERMVQFTQVGGHMAATADLSYYKKHDHISCQHFILETEQAKQRESFRLDTSLSG